MTKLIDGKTLAQNILLDLKIKITKLNRPPGLATILIGDDPASQLYVKTKKKTCLKIGIEFHDYLCGGRLCPDITQNEILEMIDWLNHDSTVDGIIVQLPLPKKFNAQKIIDRIDPKKDVDGFHPKNKLKLIEPPLVGAIKLALQSTGEKLSGKKTVVISKNPIFSAPLIKSLAAAGLKLKTVEPDDKNLKAITKAADVLITVVGQKSLVKKSMIKDDVIIIDAGSTLIGENQWAGDVDPAVKKIASWFTPVPGGIGPLTVAMLLKNTYELAKHNQ
ncbi:MAG: bifunctional 5,10-methylenetetrahydrofolate dehydrogenase/5,10-methenyltetrahydrofolate cyclohydrolase [Patescibacteria group bacterium]